MAFETLDLPRIYAAAEQLKGARRQSRLDDLREMGLQAKLDQNKTTFDQGQQDRERTLGLEKAKTVDAKAGNILAASDAKAYITANEPDLIPHLGTLGIDFNTADDATIREKVEAMRNHAREALGVGPVPRVQHVRDESGALLEIDPITGQTKQVVAPQKKDNTATLEAGRDRRSAAAIAASQAAAAETRAAAERTAKEQRDFIAEQNRLNREATAASKSPNSQQAIQERQRTINVYETARDGLMSALDKTYTSTGPVIGRLPAFFNEDQAASGAVSAMAPVLKQIFRSSGEGAFTDKDQELLLEMVPTRADEAEARAVKIANIDKIVSAKLGLPVKPYADAATIQANPATAAPTLQPGSSYKHASGATVTILPD
jgi:hypothetical protein